jgi:hypothetical protein
MNNHNQPETNAVSAASNLPTTVSTEGQSKERGVISRALRMLRLGLRAAACTWCDDFVKPRAGQDLAFVDDLIAPCINTTVTVTTSSYLAAGEGSQLRPFKTNQVCNAFFRPKLPDLQAAFSESMIGA